MTRKTLVLLLGLLVLKRSYSSSGNEYGDGNHHRQKRVLWITNDGRIALPPGTVMTITPTLALPFVRYPPYGFLSNMTISLPFTIDFDKLGLTDNENPYGALPPAFDRSARGRKAGMIMADFIAAFIKRRLHKRDTIEVPKDAFHGGERALLYGTAEDMLSTLGLNGKACLLRAICEVHGHPLNNFGLIGEMLKLFLTASKSPFANILNEYVEAENRGKLHGECWPYFKDCPKSLFLPSINKYMKDPVHENDDTESDDKWNQISRDVEEDVVERIPKQNSKHTMHPSM
ncbi:uncharacterized protein LOC124946529 isoform X1 [Vespa velutina]|uniref:uncharacterized protein LOC124946529 isoform X1 n=1 Tax=Vespa velutina TaxID=202808 RepID=UPI001FB25357|nr:uncharacterized protein LOC124946529 isoform X1 [Vespa velutina]XP_047343267.1 uncharacterized protein LOC124946529 isoform X1 [Vespa velutina]XP_047343268.1 uncharacterized protein LOC124946529 isoform X1 [Vespa velutina]